MYPDDEEGVSRLEKKLKASVEQQQADRDTWLIELKMLNSPAQLKELHAKLVVKQFAPGTVVDWDRSLRNRSVYGPFVVIQHTSEPALMGPSLGVDATSSGFLDPIDTQVMMRSSDESVLTMWLDSRHLVAVG